MSNASGGSFTLDAGTDGRELMFRAIPRTWRPGLWVFSMTFAWVFPFFVWDMARLDIPVSEIGPSVALYIIVLGVAAMSGFLMGYIERITRVWERMRALPRYVYLMAIYSTNFCVILFVMQIMPQGLDFEYFGGGPDISFLMAYFPSIVVYGSVGCVGLAIVLTRTAFEILLELRK